MPRTVLVLLTFLVASLGATPARAAEFHSIRNSKVYAGSPGVVAQTFLQARTAQYDLSTVELVVQRILARGDYRTVRLVQQHDGLRVLGTAAAVRVSPEARVTVAALRVFRELTVSTTPYVSQADVRTLLHSLVGPWAANGSLRFLLAVLPESRGPGRLVWQVDVPTGRGGLRYVVDAHRGVVLHSRSLAVETLGRVYPISSVVTPTTQDLELTDLDDASPLVLTGWDGQFFVTNYVSGGSQSTIEVEQALHPSDASDFLYDPPVDPTDATDGFAQVQLYYHLTRMRDHFADNHGVDFSQPAYSLLAVANMMEDGAPMDNAYFSEQGMGAPWDTNNLIAIGQGTSLDFAVDSDVFLHEFTHYVNNVSVGFNMGQMAINEYGITPHSGSIDEGLADYGACTVNGDPLLGEASLVPYGSGRDLTDTSKVCPKDVFGEVHMDGEIIGSVSWTLYETFGKAASDQLVWGATTLLLPYASFGDYAQALVQTANEMVTDGQLVAADVQTLQDILDARGLSDCFHELSIAPAAPRTLTLFGLDVLAMAMGASCTQMRSFGVQLASFFHLRHTPAATDTGVRFAVQLTVDGGSSLQWKIFGREGEHVTFESSGMMPSVSEYDYQTAWLDTTTGEIVIDETSDPPFDPTQTYHFVIAHQNCPNSEALITVEAIANTVEPDAGVDSGVSVDASGPEDNPNKGGCDCQSSGDAGSSLPVLMLLLVLGLIWRRRAST